MFRITHLLFATASISRYSISINLHCVSTIICTSMACYIINCTYVNNCSCCTTTLSSFVSFYIVCASTKLCVSALSSFDFLMHIEFIDVVLGPTFFLHTNKFCFYAKIQLQMFQLYLCFQLSFVQIVSSHYMSSFLHISKMMMNVVIVTTLTLCLQPRQGLAKVRTKREAQESHLMLLRVQENVRE